MKKKLPQMPLHAALCPPVFQCAALLSPPQYTPVLHREHGFRATLRAACRLRGAAVGAGRGEEAAGSAEAAPRK